MDKTNELDEIEVVDLEEYSCSDKPIPKKTKYFLIKVDKEKIRVQSPITAEEILIAADLNPEEHKIKQKFKDKDPVLLEHDQSIDLREKGIERFKTSLRKNTSIFVNGREKVIPDNKLLFSDLIRIAFETPPTGQNICFTVTYRNGPKKNPDGKMVEDSKVKIKEGMVFNVTATDKS